MTDGHYAGYQEMLDRADWEKYGVVDGVIRDSRCENCMVHCGYDPSGALGTNYQRGDHWKNIKYNFGSRPKPCLNGHKVNAFNGFSIGQGHLSGTKAAGSNRNTPKAIFHHEGNNGNDGDLCGNGDSARRDEPPVKIRDVNKIRANQSGASLP
jgi:hypothetical protein